MKRIVLTTLVITERLNHHKIATPGTNSHISFYILVCMRHWCVFFKKTKQKHISDAGEYWHLCALIKPVIFL